MASSLSENLACVNGFDHDHDHVLKHNSFLLVSRHNDQELYNMIRSLEAEINPNPNPNPNTRKEEDRGSTQESRLLIDDVQLMNVHDCSASINGLDLAFTWNDDNMAQVSSFSPSDVLNLCKDFCGNDDKMDDMVEFGAAVEDQYCQFHCSGVSLDMGDHSYSSVWHETLNDTVLYCQSDFL